MEMDPAQFIDPSLGVPTGTPATSLPGSITTPQPANDTQVHLNTTPSLNISSGIVSPMEQGMIMTQQPMPPSPMVTTPTTPLTHVMPYSPLSTASQLIQKRRSSTRSIKRKKFDDEVVESSLQIKPAERTPRMKELGKFDISPLVAVASPTPDVVPVQPTIPPAPVTPVVQPPPEKKPRERKPSKSRSKKTNKSSRSVVPSLPPAAASTKDLGRWKPQDDLALITNVQQTNDLTAVHLGVKFSCKFTLREVQERWYALLYDPVLSKLAVQAIKQLHPDIIASIQSKTLFSKDEETLLGKVSSTSQPTLDVFEDMLQKNSDTFYPARTSKALYSHWLLMKQYHLLPDQSVQPMPRGDHVLNFSDAEDIINDEDLREPRDEALEHELTVADRRQKREIRHLEQELPKWQVLVDSITGISPPDFDNQTLAVLRGRLVRYLMRSREITLGRATKDNPIDVDLSLEGPAWKISRRQGVIKLRNNGDFFVANEGRRPIYIDGKPVLNGNKQKLNNNSVVEISCLRFIFLINQDLINVIRAEAQKLNS